MVLKMMVGRGGVTCEMKMFGKDGLCCRVDGCLFRNIRCVI